MSQTPPIAQIGLDLAKILQGVWSDARASLGVAKATKLVMLELNLHIECKMLDIGFDRNLIK